MTNKASTTPTNIQNALVDMIEEAIADNEPHCQAMSRVKSFADSGLLTSDAGIVIKLHNGAEFQLTIVRSN